MLVIMRTYFDQPFLYIIVSSFYYNKKRQDDVSVKWEYDAENKVLFETRK